MFSDHNFISFIIAGLGFGQSKTCFGQDGAQNLPKTAQNGFKPPKTA